MTNMELLIKNAENELQALQKTVGHEAVYLNELLLELKKQQKKKEMKAEMKRRILSLPTIQNFNV